MLTSSFVRKPQYATSPTTGKLEEVQVPDPNYYMQVGDMEMLAFTLREKLGLFGTKVACEMGQCGACTVLVDDVATFEFIPKQPGN